MCEGIGFAVRKVPPRDMAAKSRSQKRAGNLALSMAGPCRNSVGLAGSFPQSRAFIYREGRSGFRSPEFAKKVRLRFPSFYWIFIRIARSKSLESAVSACFATESREKFMVNKGFATSLNQFDPIEPTRVFREGPR